MMGCKDCEAFAKAGTGTYPYRWKHATVELIACEQHAREIFDALNSYQEGELRK
jgi:hypothetical protein